ncbi:MAG: hypothetical protein KAS91_00470 [Candidatus Pacebacteria bacterium]|nr:hypothetical protein [Candidatus Paceibacterota bacterium]
MKNYMKKIDFCIILGLFIIGTTLWLHFNLKPLFGALLGILPIVFYLMIRRKKNIKKIFWAVIIFGGLFGFVFDFIQSVSKAWFVERLVIPWRIFGILPVDDVIGFLLMTLFIVVCYEHFIDDEKNRKVSKNLIWALVPSILATVAIILIFLFVGPESLKVSYAYLAGGSVAIILPIFMSIRKPKLIPKFLITGVFFSVVWFVAEIIALKTGAWSFPGEYIGTVSVFSVVFPLEELFFWVMLYAVTIVSYYELFIDDMK